MNSFLNLSNCKSQNNITQRERWEGRTRCCLALVSARFTVFRVQAPGSSSLDNSASQASREECDRSPATDELCAASQIPGVLGPVSKPHLQAGCGQY